MLQVESLQTSFEKVKPQADAFVDAFYNNLFTMYPSAKPLFEHTNMAKQQAMLLQSLVMTVENLTNPDVLTKKLQGLGARHVKYGALPEHYPLVGNALLTTFEQLLAEDWTEEVKQAWVEAYGVITELMLSGADYSAEEVALESVSVEKQVEAEEEGLNVDLLQSSFEKVKPQADAFVEGFYHNLFTMYPSAKPLFEHTDMAKQQAMLLQSLVMTVENLTNPDVLTNKLQGLGARHVKYGALPEHYPLVGNALLTTFEQLLAEDWTQEVKQAWVKAYGAITELMLSGADYSAEEVALESVSVEKQVEAEEEGLNVDLLQSSFEKVKPQADAFVEGFYHNLFTMYPSAKPLFEHTNMAKQQAMLLQSLVMTVDNLTNPDVLTKKLQGLGARHVKYGALPEHYPLVGNALLTTFEQLLAEDWTQEVKQAWIKAYGVITELMLSGADYSAEEVALESVSAEKQVEAEAQEEEGLNVELLQSSFLQVKPKINAFVDGFYRNLFTMYPQVQPLFEHTNMGTQKIMLLESLITTVNNLTNPEFLTQKLQGLGARHVKYGALPEHYPCVGNALLTTFEELLAEDWTAEVKQAWVKAYGVITELMLSGADYTAEEIALESSSTIANPVEKTTTTTQPVTTSKSDRTVVEKQNVNQSQSQSQSQNQNLNPSETKQTDSAKNDSKLTTILGSVLAFGGVGIVALLILL